MEENHSEATDCYFFLKVITCLMHNNQLIIRYWCNFKIRLWLRA